MYINIKIKKKKFKIYHIRTILFLIYSSVKYNLYVHVCVIRMFIMGVLYERCLLLNTDMMKNNVCTQKCVIFKSKIQKKL